MPKQRSEFVKVSRSLSLKKMVGIKHRITSRFVAVDNSYAQKRIIGSYNLRCFLCLFLYHGDERQPFLSLVSHLKLGQLILLPIVP